MSRTATELYNTINDTIYALTSGKYQSKTLTINGHTQTYTALNILDLFTLRDKLAHETSSESSGDFLNPSFATKGRFT